MLRPPSTEGATITVTESKDLKKGSPQLSVSFGRFPCVNLCPPPSVAFSLAVLSPRSFQKTDSPALHHQNVLPASLPDAIPFSSPNCDHTVPTTSMAPDPTKCLMLFLHQGICWTAAVQIGAR